MCPDRGIGMNFRRRHFAATGTFFIILGVLSAPSILRAQTARVTGTVLDTSGAAVVGVTVTATNAATSVERSTTHTDTGPYTNSSLPPAVYNVSLTKAGFKVARFAQITLTVDQTMTLDAKLEVGTVSATVEVAAANVEQIENKNATLTKLVEHKQMTDLPLILREPYQLVLLGPGVTQ